MSFNLLTLMRSGPLVLFLAPWILLTFTCVIAPTYYGNVIGDPVCLGFLVFMLIWDVIGLGLAKAAPSGLVKFLIFLIFTLPLCIGVSIAPAIVTILRAVVPILIKNNS